MKKFLLLLTFVFYLFTSFEWFAMIWDSQDNPARSCKEIKHINSWATDGIYWLKSGSMTEAKNYYCDMTTDGWW